MNKKILWISSAAPYDDVPHAGGQIENYYVKQLNMESDISLELITFCAPNEVDKVDADLCKYNVSHYLINDSQMNTKDRIVRKLMKLYYKYFIYNKYGCFVNKYTFYQIKEQIEKNHLRPDIVVLEWTQTILYVNELHKLLPRTKFVCVEEDVSYLSYKRKAENSRGLNKYINTIKYNKLKKIELKSLLQANKTVLNNNKDLSLIKKSGVNNGFVWVPFFHLYSNLKRCDINKDILFFGAMDRYENYESAIWFINNVLNKLEDKEIRFIIVGNRPHESLLKLQSERIIVTGFVESVEPYFQSCACLVAPLVLGAGVKIKILEAMSSGIPVITNHIGIEGIPAKNGEEYYYCESSSDYINIINSKINSNEMKQIGENGRNFILNNYDYKKSSREFIQMIKSL